MARAMLVKAARKDYPEQGIKKGESYYWWKFRHGGKHFSKSHPRPSQLTGSEFLSAIYGLQERLEDLDPKDFDELQSEIEDISSEIRSLGEEQDEKRSNMPDSLQDSETGQLLEQRQEYCESMADELDDLQMEAPEKEEGETEDNFQDRLTDELTAAVTDCQAIQYQGE